MTNRDKIRSQRGQVSVFFATTIIIVISLIAFIINIGLFVKAKLNLQNATDAAAYAGAAVQARQLTNIAYLNYEMRNVYKEWMFKTYVLSNPILKDVSEGPSGDTVDFRMEAYATGARTIYDNYNFPSVCLDFSNGNNYVVCKKALVPGLPSFQSNGITGMEETMDAFISAISDEKSQNCMKRTQLNFMTNMNWAYKVPKDETFKDRTPDVATDRPGAFPSALNLAFRIRNVEFEMNKKPFSSGVCITPGSGVNCSQSIDEVLNSNKSPSLERINKAFYSGFRNLGGNDCSDSGGEPLKCSFTLTEIPPRKAELGEQNSLSNLLIPANKRDKYYVDLKLMTVNLATFFTMMMPDTEEGGYDGTDAGNADSVGQCIAVKVGMPIPGYPMGFVKNPEVLTYYAVRGQSQFVGLFNPFSEPVTLTAFAAAKPFGGRVGPMLFKMNQGGSNPTSIRARHPFNRTSAYISAIDTTKLLDRNGNLLQNGVYASGAPLPTETNGNKFWLEDENSDIGGWVTDSAIFFGIPNIIYDYPDASPQDSSSYFANAPMQLITPTKEESTEEKAGLYNAKIFNKFRALLSSLGAGVIDSDSINNAVLLTKAPTLYDSHNYLIPTPEDLNKSNRIKTDSFGIISNPAEQNKINGNSLYSVSLYGPLFSNYADTLYTGPEDLGNILETYLANNVQAIEKYKDSIHVAAQLVYLNNINPNSDVPIGFNAAKMLSRIDEDPNSEVALSNQDLTANLGKPAYCDSINGIFSWYYLGRTNVGERVATGDCKEDSSFLFQMTKYWKELSDVEKLYHQGEFILPESDPISFDLKKLYTAYMPGEQNDARNGVFKNAISKSTTNMFRNSYSTKFVALSSLKSGGSETYSGNNFSIFSEGNVTKNMDDTKPGEIKNPLETQQFDLDLSRVKH